MIDRLRPYRLELIAAIILTFLGSRYIDHEQTQDRRLATLTAEHIVLQSNQDYLLDAMCRGFKSVNVIMQPIVAQADEACVEGGGRTDG